MQIEKYKLDEHNQSLLKEHKRKFDFAVAEIRDAESVIQKLIDFQIAIPSDCVASEEAKLNRQALMLMQRVLKVDTTPSTELEFEDTKITFPQSSTAFRTDSTIR